METTRISNIGVKTTNLLRSPWQGESGLRPGLFEVIDRLRQRWRLRRLLNGLFWTLSLMIGVTLVSAWLLNHWHFANPAVWLLRFVMIFALVGLLLHFCLKPIRQRVSETRVALYLQEHEPSLGSVLSSAVDAKQARARDTSPQLVAQLVERALDACEQIGFGHKVEQQRLRQEASRLGLALLVIMLLSVAPPEFLRLSATALLLPWTNASQYSPYQIELAPGNIEIARGGDQLVSARIAGFDGESVLLFTSDNAGNSWQQAVMVAGNETGLYEFFLFDLNQPVDYYVTGAGQQTGTYRIDVADIPAISKLSLRYHFPAYTMLEPETSEGSGDIAALRGTRVEVLIKPSIEIPGGGLLLNDGQHIDLVKGESQDWVGEITVEQNSGYKITLQRSSGVAVAASSEFRITALDDKHPGVSIQSPGRDMKVSMIEEPVMKIRATDDQGIDKLELVLSVNGSAEQRINLGDEAESPGANRELSAEHTLYLEDLNLIPGDLISYYVQARDRAPDEQSRSATSDIFFYQVRPFSMNYRNSDQQGGGAGGGAQGGQQQGHLSDQQKQFVVATFKMIRDRDNYDTNTYQENLELLADAQARIRDRVEAIVRRLGTRAIVQLDERYRIITKELPLAAEAMIEVEKKLQQIEIESALSDAQVALQHLQRADAAFREINVSLANQRGGGAGSNAGFEDLADLFRLEMDKLRHQYETVQHGQQPSAAQVIDETLERLRELAHRQQQELERQLQRHDQALANDGDSKQLALAEELEAMARQLERLSRTQPNPQLQQSINQMRGAAEAMRRAAANASAGGSGRVDQARQAAQNLREAQRLLDQSRVREFSDAIERSLKRAELAEKRQAAIKQEVMQLEEQWGDTLKSQLQQLDNRKKALSEELDDLESELSQLTATASEEQPQTSPPLKQAIRASREYRLQDRIGRTREMVQLGRKDAAIDNETAIQKGIATVREHIETALENVSEPGKRGLQRSLDQMRALARQLQFLRERSANTATNRGGGITNSGQASGNSNQYLLQNLEDIATETAELGQRLLEQGVAVGDINPVLEKIKRLAQGHNGQDMPTSTELHELALNALMELEYKLRKQLSDPEYPELLVFESTDIPDDYKAMVADYFRELSRP